MATNLFWIGYHFEQFRSQAAIRKKKLISHPVISLFQILRGVGPLSKGYIVLICCGLDGFKIHLSMETHRCVTPQFNMYIASMEKMEVSWLHPSRGNSEKHYESLC